MIPEAVHLEQFPAERERPSAHQPAKRSTRLPAMFRRWLAKAEAGERCLYYRGCLATDRLEGLSTLPKTQRRALDAFAKLTLSLAEQGRLHLLQHRHGENDYSYLAVARGRRKA